MSERLARFSFDELGSWFHTLDLMQETRVLRSEDTRYATALIQYEEFLHRSLFLGTTSRFETSWTEAISSYETLCLLEEVAQLKRKDPSFRLLVPLRLNHDRNGLPEGMRTRITDIRSAAYRLNLQTDAWGQFIESLILCIQRQDVLSDTQLNSRLFQCFKSIEERKLSNGLDLQTYRHVQSLYAKVLALRDDFYPEDKLALGAFRDIISWIDESDACGVPPLLLDECENVLSDARVTRIKKRIDDVLGLSSDCLRKIAMRRSSLPTEFRNRQAREKFDQYAVSAQVLVRLSDWFHALCEPVFRPLTALRNEEGLRRTDEAIDDPMFNGSEPTALRLILLYAPMVWLLGDEAGSYRLWMHPSLTEDLKSNMTLSIVFALYKQFLLTAETPLGDVHSPFSKFGGEDDIPNSLKSRWISSVRTSVPLTSSGGLHGRYMDLIMDVKGCLEIRRAQESTINQ
jgi:hypothetical protein